MFEATLLRRVSVSGRAQTGSGRAQAGSGQAQAGSAHHRCRRMQHEAQPNIQSTSTQSDMTIDLI